MYTDPNHLRISDPGKIQGNVVFSYLDAFHPDVEEVNSLKAHYQRGGLGDTTIKKILNDTLQEQLAPIREQRASVTDRQIKDILFEGNQKARLTGEATIQAVRQAIGLSYW